jgi:hypothetical protein
MAFVRVEQRNAHLAGAVRLELVNGREGKVAKGTVTAISNIRRGSGEEREDEATAIQWATRAHTERRTSANCTAVTPTTGVAVMDSIYVDLRLCAEQLCISKNIYGYLMARQRCTSSYRRQQMRMDLGFVRAISMLVEFSPKPG